MSLISATDLAKSYGAQDVFEAVSVAIPHQARVALVGANGVGKTTLLRLLAGYESPDRGQVQRARGLRIGYLPQETTPAAAADGGPVQTLWQMCLASFADLRGQEAELARLEEEMAEPGRAEEAMARYGPLQEAFERAGGYAYPARIRQVLGGLGFSLEDYSRPTGQLSGGERTRAHLARLLLEDPDVLILDEPTNHLDMEAFEWLEGWLREWPGSAVIVSHDRYFLDRTVDSVWDMTAQGVEVYRGNYSDYARQRAERRRFLEAAHQAQQERWAKEQDYIRRNIAGQNTRQAQGRRKRLQRAMRDELIARPVEDREVRIEFDPTGRSGDQVLATHELVIGYRDSAQPLFNVPDLVLNRGECAALIGPNGAGKTTFLKTLLGQVEPLAGEVNLGASLRVGYFAQAHEGLRPDLTVLEEILASSPEMRPSEARNLLGRFLFSGDTVEKPVAILSGGERGRLALAKLALEGANLLLLDEPTTHLDIPSQEILQEALSGFPETILLVSHDRYLIEALASQVWAISPEAREMAVYPGGYGEYAEARRRQAESRRTLKQAQRRQRVVRSGSRRRGAEIETVELRIAELEEELAAVGRLLERVGGDVERVRQLGSRYAQLETEIQKSLALWERLQGEPESGVI
jgi:ATP-binding cassette subfamily F protein 3